MFAEAAVAVMSFVNLVIPATLNLCKAKVKKSSMLLEVNPNNQNSFTFCDRIVPMKMALWNAHDLCEVIHGFMSAASGYVWSPALWRDVRHGQTA